MRSIALLKIAVILGAFSGVLVLSPACKAQSEIAPDHFDGTDPWAITAQKVAAPKLRQTLVAMHANHRQVSATSLRFATNRQSSTAFHKSAPGILSRRKATAIKAEEQSRRNQEE